MLVPVGWVLFTPWRWLRILAILAGVVIMARMLTARGHRRASGEAWLLAAVVTGMGFFGYLWAESGIAGPPGATVAPRWWRAWLGALATGAGLGVAGGLILLATGRF